MFFLVPAHLDHPGLRAIKQIVVKIWNLVSMKSGIYL